MEHLFAARGLVWSSLGLALEDLSIPFDESLPAQSNDGVEQSGVRLHAVQMRFVAFDRERLVCGDVVVKATLAIDRRQLAQLLHILPEDTMPEGHQKPVAHDVVKHLGLGRAE